MKVVLIGRTEILYDAAKRLLMEGYEIPVIITAKEAPEYTRTSSDFQKLSEKIGAKFLYAPKFTNQEIEFLKEAINAVDDRDNWIGVSVNYTGVIQQKIIDLFPLGILNAHGGDLPRYRGNACQAWAILNGEERIGLCVHKMVGGELDSGDIIERDYLPIDINTKITEVYAWMYERIPQMFVDAVKKLEKDPGYVLEVQSRDPEDALRCYPRMPEDGAIDWHKSNEEILRLINASNRPYAGAYCCYRGHKLIIWDAELYDDREKYLAVPGQIAQICSDGSVVVITGRGKLRIREIEYEDHLGAPAQKIKSIRSRLVSC